MACPKRWRVVDDTVNADGAYKLACEGTALIWQGDFQNARQLLQALGRRVDKAAERRAARAPKPGAAGTAPLTPAQAFHRHRHELGQRAAVLGQLLIPLEPDLGIDLHRAPDWREACAEAYGAPGPDSEPRLVSLRELLGLNGAHEWRKKGVPIAALGGATVHAHYGVF